MHEGTRRSRCSYRRVDDNGNYYVFRNEDDAETTVSGEMLEWMQDEALELGITLEELWRRMAGNSERQPGVN